MKKCAFGMLMKRSACILPLFLLFGISVNSFGQNEADSLENLLKKAEGEERAEILLDLSAVYQRSNPPRTVEYAREALKIGIELDDRRLQARSYHKIGFGLKFMNQLDSSFYYFRMALKAYQELDDYDKMATQLLNIGTGYVWTDYDSARWYVDTAIKYYEISGNISRILYCKGFLAHLASNESDYELAGSLYNEMLALLKEHDDPMTERKTYAGMGRMYFFLGLNDLAMEYSLKALRMYEQGIDEYGADPEEYVAVATILNLQGNHEEALEYIDRHEEIVSRFERKYGLIHNKKTRAEIYAEWGKLDTAYAIIQEVVTWDRESGQPGLLLGSLLSLATINKLMEDWDALYATCQEGLQLSEMMNDKLATLTFNEHLYAYYQARKEYTKAIRHIRLCLDLAKGLERYEPFYNAYKVLSEVYESMDLPDSALAYYKLCKDYSDSLNLQNKDNMIMGMHIQYETELKEKQIAMLERDKEISELKIAHSRNLNIGIGILFVILVGMGLLFIRQNKLKNDNKSTQLEQKLLRLQMNPHFIFNALSSIHNLMNPKDVKKASDYLGNFSRLLRSLLESSREEYILLEEEITSMKNYLELQKLRYDNKFEYRIDVDRAISLESAIIPPMLIQPFIENAIEHGIRHKKDKGHVNIRFRLDNDKLSCEIEDDGVGREKAWEVEYAKKGKHRSLATEIIRDRITILNKKLKRKINLNITDLKSEANEATGTMVSLDLPYILD